MHPFRSAIEAWDMEAVPALLAEDVVFRSPVGHTPYHGRELVSMILGGVSRVFEDFRYVREIGDPTGPDHVLEFEARVGDVQVHGVDLLRTGADGLVTELVVMIRPMSGLAAVAAGMKEQFAAFGPLPGADAAS